MTTIKSESASIYRSCRIQYLTHFKVSIVLSFNRALSLLRMCFVKEKTRFDLNNIAKIENVFIVIRVSIDRRNL